jgi:hypothetical protein
MAGALVAFLLSRSQTVLRDQGVGVAQSRTASSPSDWGLAERETGRNATSDCIIRRRMG